MSITTLNPVLSSNPTQLANQHEQSEAWWNIAKSASVLGYMGISAGAFVATSLFASHLIIPVSIGVFLGMGPAIRGFNYAHETASEHEKQKIRFTRISAIQAELSSLTEQQLRLSFERAGIPKDKIDNFSKVPGGLASLVTGFATLLYLCESTNECFKKHKAALSELDRVSQPEHRTLLMREAHVWGRATMAARVHAAFMHALLRRPFCQKSLEDLGSFTNLTPEHYALENVYGNKQLPVFVFNDGWK